MLVLLGKDAGDNMDQKIEAYLHENPSEMYKPQVEPSIRSEPIITVKTQPLPNFGLAPDMSNILIQLADYGVGELWTSHLLNS